MPDVNDTGNPVGDPDGNPREALYKEAIELLNAKDKDAETKEGIRAEISEVAEAFREDRAASGTAPGLKEARSLFKDAEAAADNFLKMLKCLLFDPSTLLLGLATDTREGDQEQREKDRAERDAFEAEAKDLVNRVQQFKATLHERRRIRAGPPESGPGWPAKARQTNVREMANAGGPAEYWLVFRCYDVFEKYRLGEAKTTVGGDFHKFCNAVYDIAISDNPDDDDKKVWLKNIIENVVRARRSPRPSRG